MASTSTRDSVEAIRDTVEPARLGVVALAPDGTVRDATGDVDSLLGASPATLRGRSAREVLDGVLPDALLDGAGDGASGAVWVGTVVVPDGRHWRVEVHPGQPGALVIIRDLTMLLRYRLEASLLRRVTELANSGADAADVARDAIMDIAQTAGWAAGRVVGTTPGWDQPWQRAADSAPDADTLDGLPRSTTTSAAAARQRPETSLDHPDDPRLAAGTEVGLRGLVALPVIDDGEVLAVLEFVAADTVPFDPDLRDLLRDIGLQLGSVFARQEVLDDLRRSNAELERFAHVASHDLQEPLRKIVGFAELLADHHEPADEDEETYLGYLVDAATRMQQLIRDLLRFSRVGRTELEVHRVDLDTTVDEVLSDLEPLLAEQPVTIDRDAPLGAVRGDATLIAEALRNLVTNAVKYREADRTLRLAFTAGPGANPRTVDVTVTDNGIGIAPEQREAVFDVFRRLHPRHVHPGTGIGLALVRRIVQRHGGSARIHDGPDGQGVSVTLTLPRDEQESP